MSGDRRLPLSAVCPSIIALQVGAVDSRHASKAITSAGVQTLRPVALDQPSTSSPFCIDHQ